MIIEMLLDGETFSEWIYPDPEAQEFTLQNSEAREKVVQLLVQDIKSRSAAVIQRYGNRISFYLVYRSRMNSSKVTA
jgi:hypothetical protein